MKSHQRSRRLHCLVISLLISVVIIFSGYEDGNTASTDIIISGANPREIRGTAYGQNYWDWAYNQADFSIQETAALMDGLRVNLYRAGGNGIEWQEDHVWSEAEIDQFVAYCRQIHTEPVLQVSVYSTNRDPRTAAAMVRYCNDKGYDVKYWMIGNEPEYYRKRYPGYDVNDFIGDYKAFAAAMRNVDPDLKLIGPEVGGEGMDWIGPFLRECGTIVDVVSFHFYPFGDPGSFTIQNVMNDTGIRDKIVQVRSLTGSICGSGKPIAITETHVSWSEVIGKPASGETFYAGLWIAQTAGICLQQDLWTTLFWGTSQGYSTGFLEKSVGKVRARPAYYALQMFTTHFGKWLLQAVSPRGLAVFASRNETKDRTILIVINKTGQEQSSKIKFQDFSAPIPERQFVFPAYSLTCLSVPDDSSVMECWSYTKDLADKGQPPNYRAAP